MKRTRLSQVFVFSFSIGTMPGAVVEVSANCGEPTPGFLPSLPPWVRQLQQVTPPIGGLNACRAELLIAATNVPDAAAGINYQVGTLNYTVGVLRDLREDMPKVISEHKFSELVSTNQQGKYVKIYGRVRYPATLLGERTPVALAEQACSYVEGATGPPPCFPILFYVAADDGRATDFEHALDALVRKGFVTVAFTVTTPYAFEARMEQLNAHLAFWRMAKGRVFDVEAVANVPDSALFGKTNLYRIGLIGMSMGGEAVLATYLRMRDYDDRSRIRAILALSPSLEHAPELTQGDPIHLDKPYLVITGSNDRPDQFRGIQTYDRIHAPIKYQAYVDGAHHSWLDEPPNEKFGALARTLAAAFFRRYVAGGIERPEYNVLAGFRHAETTRSTAVAWSYQTSGSLMVDDFPFLAPGQLGIGVLLDRRTIEQRGSDIAFSARSFSNSGSGDSLFHATNGAIIRWSSPGGVVRFSLPASKDVSGYDRLAIRAAKIFEPTEDGQLLRFSLGLKDACGKEDVLPVSVRPAFTAPDPNVVRKTVLETISLPLACLADRGVDLRQVQEVVLRFDQSPVGVFALDDVQFTWLPRRLNN